MAGHSKWSKVKRLKGALDVKRGKLFSKLSKEIVVAAKLGGGNPSLNPRLRAAVMAARAQSMPNDNIDRAIKKGSGELESSQMEEIVYEGYAPGGVALVIEAATDNKNRTAADLRLIFSKNHGNLGGPGSVSFMFHRKGQITVPLAAAEEDRLLEIILEAGAEELTSDDEHHIITTPPDQLYAVAETLKKAGVEPDSQKLTYIAENHVAVADPQTASQVLKLYDALDDCDDVLNVHANFDISDEILASLQDN
ncbi:MAG: transcriptional regulator [Verrucomicrobia bacterium 61-8]|nr:YebC/PmpR family DNA-binding transcriptional regulator [Verrucomicrobiota bacterium]OJU99178.1 MAG: transcriptional regulator [Verrucomicrobia bacterium 61-8]